MSITHFLPYDACCLLQVKVGNYDRAVTAGLPMVQQHFSSISIMNLIGVTSNDYPPGQILLRNCDEATGRHKSSSRITRWRSPPADLTLSVDYQCSMGNS